MALPPNENIATYRNTFYPTVTTAAGALDSIITSLDALDALVPPASPVSFTQTYSTTGTTVSAVTYAAPSVTAGAFTFPVSGNMFDAVAADLLINVRPSVGDAAADAIADIVTNLKSLAVNTNQAVVDTAATNTKLAALAADALELRKLVTSIIDILQAAGLAA